MIVKIINSIKYALNVLVYIVLFSTTAFCISNEEINSEFKVIYKSEPDDYSVYPIIIRELPDKYLNTGLATEVHNISVGENSCIVLTNYKSGYDNFLLSCRNGKYNATITKSNTVKIVDTYGENPEVITRGNPLNTALIVLRKHLNTVHKNQTKENTGT